MGPRFRFPRTARLRLPAEFRRVYGTGTSKRVGPLVVHACANGGSETRLGLSVSRRVGNAVRRNRVKRQLREVFRHLRHDLPGGYDLVITVRPHAPLSTEAYRDKLRDAWTRIDRRITEAEVS